MTVVNESDEDVAILDMNEEGDSNTNASDDPPHKVCECLGIKFRRGMMKLYVQMTLSLCVFALCIWKLSPSDSRFDDTNMWMIFLQLTLHVWEPTPKPKSGDSPLNLSRSNSNDRVFSFYSQPVDAKLLRRVMALVTTAVVFSMAAYKLAVNHDFSETNVYSLLLQANICWWFPGAFFV